MMKSANHESEMSQIGFPTCLLVAVLTVLVSGCASYSNTVSGLADKGYDSINLIDLREQDTSPMIVSYGRISGSREHPVSIHELVEVVDLTRNYDSAAVIRIYSPATEDVESTRKQLRLTSSAELDFLAATTDAIDKSIKTLPNVMSLDIELRIVAAPKGSGYSTRQYSDSSNPPMLIVFAAGHDLNESLESAANWWYVLTELVVHELLHLEQYLAGLDNSSSSVNREVAAYLNGYCATARFVQALGVELTKGIEPNEDAFPGLTESIFAPNMTKIETIGHASEQGRTLARAVLYHLFMDEDGTLSLEDPESTAPLLEMCESLVRHIPDFTQGELE